MQKTLHRANTRGSADHGWLKSFHTFSFAEYYDESRMHFGALRVLNDDWIAPGQGFGTHPHKDMEIVTVPLLGTLQHKDSTGGEGLIHKGEVQIMSAGTGIRHSEFNASKTEECGLLQIWILPAKNGIPPRYEQKEFSRDAQKNQYQTVVSPDRRDGSLWINQNAFFSLANFSGKIPYEIRSPGNGAYFFVISGSAQIAGEKLSARDAIGTSDSGKIEVEGNAELLVIEVPMN
jgi:redox-sensitive bicupin YhaK (pirin superfamily)